MHTDLYTHVMTPQRESTMSNQEIDSCERTSYQSLFLEPASELADRLYLLTRFSPINPRNPQDKRLLKIHTRLISELHEKIQDSLDSLSVSVI